MYVPRKVFGAFGSSFCDTIYLSRRTHAPDPNSPNLFRGTHCI